KKTKKHTTPGIRWSSPTQLLIRPSLAYLWESGRDPEFSSGYGRMCYFDGFRSTMRVFITVSLRMRASLPLPSSEGKAPHTILYLDGCPERRHQEDNAGPETATGTLSSTATSCPPPRGHHARLPGTAENHIKSSHELLTCHLTEQPPLGMRPMHTHIHSYAQRVSVTIFFFLSQGGGGAVYMSRAASAPDRTLRPRFSPHTLNT
ncbi:hypothetical protein LY76DRAFT_666176, partial [Colletotrichum caudatum]